MLIGLALIAAGPANASTDDCLYALEYAWAAQSSVEYAQSVCGSFPALTRALDRLGRAIAQLELACDDEVARNRAIILINRALFALDHLAGVPFLSADCLDAIASAQDMAELALEHARLCEPAEPEPASACGAEGETNTCTVYLDRGSVVCSGSDAPAAVTSTDSGMVLSLDMTAYEAVQVDADMFDPSGWALHVGNSPTNDGWCGDGSTTDNDSEAWIYGTGVQVCASDRGGSSYPLSDGGVVDASGDHVTLEVCDG